MFCLFDESPCSNICTLYVTMEYIQLNWLCKQMKKLKSNQAFISKIFLYYWLGKTVFPCEYPWFVIPMSKKSVAYDFLLSSEFYVCMFNIYL